MAIEKMELVNIAGLVKDLDTVLLKCCESKCFHIEYAIHSTEHKNSGLETLNEENPYADILKKIVGLASNLEVKFESIDYTDIGQNVINNIDEYIDEIQDQYNDLNSRLQFLNQSISEKEQAIKQLKHLSGLTANFEQIFA